MIMARNISLMSLLNEYMELNLTNLERIFFLLFGILEEIGVI